MQQVADVERSGLPPEMEDDSSSLSEEFDKLLFDLRVLSPPMGFSNDWPGMGNSQGHARPYPSSFVIMVRT